MIVHLTSQKKGRDHLICCWKEIFFKGDDEEMQKAICNT